MSRPINESIQTLDTSLDMIKEKLSEHLTEGGGMPEQLKVSEIPGYLDQIQSGGGGGFNYIENVTLDRQALTGPALTSGIYMEYDIGFELTFTPKEDDLIVLSSDELNITPETGESFSTPGKLIKSTEYKVTGTSTGGILYVLICKNELDDNIIGKLIEPIDAIVKIVF